MEANIIFTFDTLGQVMCDGKLPSKFTPLKSDMNLLLCAMQVNLTKEEKANLVKVSIALTMTKQPPEWFMERSGKYWLDDIDKIRQALKIESTVSEETSKRFYANNKSL